MIYEILNVLACIKLHYKSKGTDAPIYPRKCTRQRHPSTFYLCFCSFSEISCYVGVYPGYPVWLEKIGQI